MAATDGVEQDREEHADRGRRQEERQDRAARGDLHRQRRADEQQADEQQHVVAVPERRPEPPHPGQQHARRAGPTAGTSQRSWRRPAPSSPRPSASIISMVGGVERLDRSGRSTWPWAMRTRTGSTAAAGGPRSVSVSSSLNDELGTTQRADELGGEHPLGLVEVAGHPADQTACGPRRPPCRGARSAASRRGPARPRPGRRPARRVEGDERRLRASSGRFGDGRLEERLPVLGGRAARSKARVDAVDPVVEGDAAARRRSRSPCRS